MAKRSFEELMALIYPTGKTVEKVQKPQTEQAKPKRIKKPKYLIRFEIRKGQACNIEAKLPTTIPTKQNGTDCGILDIGTARVLS